jgi:hypothetical protein
MSDNEQNKPKSYEENLEEHARKEEERKQRMEQVRKDTIKHLQSDPAIQEYLGKFNPHSIEHFIHGYANKKMMFSEYHEMYQNIAERNSLEYIERAEHCLEEIQFKKLFDFRCKWGAGLVKAEETKVAWDFLYWGKNTLNCPFIPTIQQEEFDLYKQYIMSDQYRDMGDIQIDEIREKDENDDDVYEMPAWFNFHNVHTGASSNLILPDNRLLKEEAYLDIIRNIEHKKIEEKYESGEIQRHVQDDRPLINDYYAGNMLQFIDKFETPKTARLFKEYIQQTNSVIDEMDEEDETGLNEQIERIINDMSGLPKGTKVPIKENADWREGLILAWDEFEKQKTIQCLDAAYDNYLFRLENKIAFDSTDHYEFYIDMANKIRKDVLQARKILGEPENFDY